MAVSLRGAGADMIRLRGTHRGPAERADDIRPYK